MRMQAIALLVTACALASGGCEDELQVSTSSQGKKAKAAAKKKKKSGDKEESRKLPPKVDFGEAEFAESEKSRDPFRSFDKQFEEERQGQVESQRKVILEEYSIEQLKLIGIITRLHPARAMLVDPSGIGHVIKRGQFIGKPEIVQTAKGVGASYEVNWRVDRIRAADVVLVKEDPTNPDVPSATRVVSLHLEGEGDLFQEIDAAGS